MNVQEASSIPFLRRVSGSLFCCLIGIVFFMVTLLDVTFIYLARPRKTGLGSRSLLAPLGKLLLSPTRRAFWAVGFWVAFLTLFSLLLRL